MINIEAAVRPAMAAILGSSDSATSLAAASVAGNGDTFGVGQVASEPVVALRQRLGVR